MNPSSTPARRPRLRRSVPVLALGLALAGALAAPAVAQAERDGREGARPSVLPLPDGFRPEGIEIAGRRTAYLGSLADGDIYRLDLRTGEGEVVIEGPGTPSVGLKLGRGHRLFVAGGNTGTARVLNVKTGRTLRDYALGGGFVNDVTLSKRAAFFTDSFLPQFYRVPLGPRGGTPALDKVRTIGLGGEWVQGDEFGANGITLTPDRRALLIVNSTTGLLYRVNSFNGTAKQVDLGGASLTNGDGMLLRGRTLHVVRNQLNRVDVLRLAKDGRSGRFVRTLTSPLFDVPTTVARAGRSLYLPNARFGTEPTPDTTYEVVRIRARR